MRYPINRYYTHSDSLYDCQTFLDTMDWKVVEVDLPKGETVAVQVPEGWMNTDAIAIVAAKYFKVINGEMETSVKQVISRIVETIVGWGHEHDYFVTEREGAAFGAELAYILYYQKACFNSPVLMNVGVPGRIPQVSACFLTAVDDTMESILDHGVNEGLIFKGGSGSGVNVSRLRPEGAPLSAGGTSSGPLSFMRGWDSMANAIKSGGTTRRAARMVVMDADHPDIMGFIGSKVGEEEKARALVEAGYDDGIDGEARDTVSFQNANHSVLVDDAFMNKANTDLDSREAKVLQAMGEAAWACGDPGIIFKDAMNRYHTTPADGPIDTVNPCSEFHHHAWTSCNLSSIDLVKLSGRLDLFGGLNDTFNSGSTFLRALEHVTGIMALAQDICIQGGAYPIDRIRDATHRYRPIGIGFTNLGGLLIRNGLPYASVEGRRIASTAAAYMSLFAWETSTWMASRMGPFAAYEDSADDMRDALGRQAENYNLIECQASDLHHAWVKRWESMIHDGVEHGYRNSYTTNIAPVGTISFFMDNDTTGVEPEIALTRTKSLVGGGFITSASRAIEDYLRDKVGDQHADEIIHEMRIQNTADLPDLLDEYESRIFLTALPDSKGRALMPEDHLMMLAAVQPFLSGGISKTVNCPSDYSVEDIQELYVKAWKLGLKCVAVYRDGSKVVQPVESGKGTDDTEVVDLPTLEAEAPQRRRLPTTTQAVRHKFSVAGMDGYIHAGEHADGTLGEIFLTVGHQGSTFDGIMDSFATAVSIGLQYGVPLEVLCDKMVGRSFEPNGFTGDADIPQASSIVDYVFRWLQNRYGSTDTGDNALDDSSPVLIPTMWRPGAFDAGSPVEFTTNAEAGSANVTISYDRVCHLCGSAVQQTGSCYTCLKCGETSGGCA